jgi:hypothetical protein
MQPVTLRLVCHGDAAQWEHALHPHPVGPLIQCLTQSVSFHTTGLNFLVDGEHEAVYVARGACRDVYRIGESIVLKLCTRENDRNPQEVAALQATQHLPQTPVFFFYGDCDIVTDSITLTVSCLLASYQGWSLDRLMHMHFALPFNLTTANFFVSAYQNLAMMVIGGVAQQISYTDIYTDNVATQADPTQHVLGAQVDVVFVDARSVRQGVLPRHAFNRHLDCMICAIELECAAARHESWHFFGSLITRHFKCFFKNMDQHDLETVSHICLDRFRRLWLDVSREGKV